MSDGCDSLKLRVLQAELHHRVNTRGGSGSLGGCPRKDGRSAERRSREREEDQGERGGAGREEDMDIDVE